VKTEQLGPSQRQWSTCFFEAIPPKLSSMLADIIDLRAFGATLEVKPPDIN
jgi:hypothetical protein